MTHLERELDKLKRKILALGALVENNLRFAFQAIEQRDRDKARKVIVGERAMALIDEHPIPVPAGFAVMSDRTGSILEKVLDALVRQDVHAAREVLAADDEIDMLYQGLIEDLKHIIRTDPEHLDAIVLMFSVARYLERLADHATNIAEDVIYMVDGEIRRHQAPDTPAGLFHTEGPRR